MPAPPPLNAAQALVFFFMTADMARRTEALVDCIEPLLSAVEAWLWAPHEEGGEAAELLATKLGVLAVMLPETPHKCWGAVVALLGRIAAADPPIVPAGAEGSRVECVQSLLMYKPGWGQYSAEQVPPGLVEACVRLADNAAVATTVTQLFSELGTSVPTVMEGAVRPVLEALRRGNTGLAGVLESHQLYAKDPAAFEEHVDVVAALGVKTAALMYDMSATPSGAAALAPHFERLLELIEDRNSGMMRGMLLTAAAGVAKARPDVLPPLADRAVAAALGAPAIPGGHIHAAALAGALALCPGLATHAMTLLCERVLPGAPADSVSSVLNCVINAAGAQSEGAAPALLGPHMAALRERGAGSVPLLEKIEDAFAGRSLEAVDARLGALEQRVAALNGEFAAACQNYGEVSAMMDGKIAELKEFVAEVAQKLPQPNRLVVVGGIRKTIVLHFACARTGVEVTSETREWHQWCKVGFGLLKLGKCVAVAATGNPMALTAGADAVRDIYAGFKSKDDADFDTFIRQPFLTSKERDKLIEQLRKAHFFDKMAYDAQLGDWVTVASLDGGERDAEEARRAGAEAAVARQQHVKGKNLGLGSPLDAVAAVARVGGEVLAVAAGDLGEVGGEDLGDRAGEAGAALADGAHRLAADRCGNCHSRREWCSCAGGAPPPRRRKKRSWFGGGRRRDRDRIEALEARVAELERLVLRR